MLEGHTEIDEEDISRIGSAENLAEIDQQLEIMRLGGATRRTSSTKQLLLSESAITPPGTPVRRAESSSSLSSAMGSGNVIPIVSLSSTYIDTTDTEQLFLRRFVSTQLYAAYNQEILDIMQNMEEVVINSEASEERVSAAATRTSVGSSATGGRAKKSRSRSLYVVPEATQARSLGDRGSGNASRKRSSSSVVTMNKSGAITSLRKELL